MWSRPIGLVGGMRQQLHAVKKLANGGMKNASTFRFGRQPRLRTSCQPESTLDKPSAYDLFDGCDICRSIRKLDEWQPNLSSSALFP